MIQRVTAAPAIRPVPRYSLRPGSSRLKPNQKRRSSQFQALSDAQPGHRRIEPFLHGAECLRLDPESLCAGLKQNLLYDLLKRRSARQLERPLTRFPFQSLLSLIGAAALLCPAVAAMLVEAAFRRGGTIE